ncbi:hypothetical protein AB0J42_37605 [Nonomuraea sp. NPDC049649]|uniref:hypothetical protein n=1 Tax=Nonomuraea sp. NPDC049649 TaxID=3155776 RepID=UPI00341D6C0F
MSDETGCEGEQWIMLNMTPRGGRPVSSALVVLAITWLSVSLDLMNFLYTDTGYLYLKEVVGIPTPLVALLWLGSAPAGFVLALLYGRKVATEVPPVARTPEVRSLDGV